MHSKYFKCIDVDCKTNKLPWEAEKKFFNLPRNDTLRNKWIINMNRTDLFNFKHEYFVNHGLKVCHLHFDDNQFRTNEKKKLNILAVPREVFPLDVPSISSLNEQRSLDQSISQIDIQCITPQTIQIEQKSQVSSTSQTESPQNVLECTKKRKRSPIYDAKFPSTCSCKSKATKIKEKMEPIILVHGGAGDIGEERIPGKIKGVILSANKGYSILKSGGSALDAVEAAVRLMEDDEYFNAGYGSVLNLDGEVEMGASIMNGIDLNAGAVALVQDVANPITLARRVMEKTPHTLLGAAGASRFAREQGIPAVCPSSLVTEHAKTGLADFKKTGYVRTELGSTRDGGTVGAVAVDKFGHVAAATSTGGMNGKMVGRIGDTPLIGSGTYADDNVGGVSTTGHGETILKYCLAHSIIKDMASGKTAEDATKSNIETMTERLKNTAGAITLSKTGDVGIYFSSKRMAWAYQTKKEVHYGINHNQHEIEKL